MGKKILYTAASDADKEQRDGMDGPIRHIVRKKKPDVVFIFLTREMKQYEDKIKEGILEVSPECKVEFLDGSIAEPHKLDKLVPVIKEFIKIRNDNRYEEILINLTSGTPQIKLVMSLLALDGDNVEGIQVTTYKNGSNQGNEPKQSKADAAKSNEELDEIYNRCFIPDMKPLKRYKIKHQLEKLVKAYDYKAASEIYEKNKGLFNDKVGMLLEHACRRINLHYEKLFSYEAKALKYYPDLCVYDKSVTYWKEIAELNEFLMIMQLRQKRGELSEFIVKITPFLFRLLHFYMERKLGINFADFCETPSGVERIVKEKLKETYPNLYSALSRRFPNQSSEPGKNYSLGFYNMLVMLENVPEAQAIVALGKDLRKIEKTYRNKFAHTIIVNIDESYLSDNNINFETNKLKSKKLTSGIILDNLWNIFNKVMRGEKTFTKNVYEDLNKKIIENLNGIK